MKKQLFFLIGLALLLSSCKDEKTASKKGTSTETKKNPVNEIAKLNAELKKYEVPSQIFKISSDKKNTLKSKLGTTIYVNPADLETIDGTAMGKTIEVELKELTNQKHLLRSNAQTVSGGKLLVSGGAYFINLTSDDKQLKLKDGKSLAVDFPKLAKEKMTLFYGEKDSSGVMDWKLTDTKFSSRQRFDSIAQTLEEIPYEDEQSDDDINNIIAYTDNPKTKEGRKKQRELKKNEQLENEIYHSIKLKKLGWINCDRFPEIEEKTNLEYVIDNADNITTSNVYLIFKDINSLMQNTYFSDYGSSESHFINIPVDYDVALIAVSIKDDKKYSFKTNLKVKNDEKVTIILKETSDKDFEQLFQ